MVWKYMKSEPEVHNTGFVQDQDNLPSVIPVISRIIEIDPCEPYLPNSQKGVFCSF